MKKHTRLMGAVIIAALLTSCTAAGPNKNGAVSGGAAVETKSERKIVLGFAQVGDESDWRTANSESIQSAAKDAGIQLLFTDCKGKQENQIQAIRVFVAQQVEAIAFSPIVESGWETVLKEVKETGIPVILTDRKINLMDQDLYVSFIGSDFTEEGRKAGQWLVDKTRDINRDIRILEIQGTKDSAPALGRYAGFRAAIRENPRLKIVRTVSGDFMHSMGKQVMEDYLKEEPVKFDVLFAHNDDMALGAIQAMEEFGLKPGKDILIVSVDGIRDAFQAMAEGKLNCSVECNPLIGPQLIETVKNVVAGRPVPRTVVSQERVFTQDMAERELPNRKY